MSIVLPITEDPRFRVYTATSGQTQFAVPFPFQQNDDVDILLRQTNGDFSLLSSSLYILTGAADPSGGMVTFATGRTAGEVILVLGRAILDRTSSVVANGRFASKLTDDELDRVKIIQQELARDSARALKADFGQAGLTMNSDLTDGSTLMKLGSRIVKGPDAGDIIAAQDYAEEAKTARDDVIQRFLGSFANDAAATAAAGTPFEGQTYWNTTNDTLRFWDGSAWLTAPYATAADDSISTDKLIDGSVTADKISGTNTGVYAIRKRLRNMPDLGDYGIFGGSTDWVAADFTAMETALFADGHSKVLVPAGGNIRLAQQITITRGVFFEGEGMSNSVFSFFHNNNGFLFTGQNGNGGGMKDLSVVKGNTGNANAFVQVYADVGGWSPDYISFDTVNLTGLVGGTASYPLLLDGKDRTGVAPNGLVGLRNVKLHNLDIFNATFMTLEVRACKAIRILGCNVFQGGGTVGRTQINGTSPNQSTGVMIQGSALGDLFVDYANTIIGFPNNFTNVTVSANATNNRIGTAFGTVSNSSASTQVYT